jgi:integrase
MTLDQLVERYVQSRDLSVGYVNQLRWFAAALCRTAGGMVDVQSLAPSLINGHLRECRERGLSDETRRSRRRMFLTLAEAAIDEGLAPEFTRRRVMRIKRRARVIRAWNEEQVRALLAVARAAKGKHCDGVQRAIYWGSYVPFGWDTGLRGVDIRTIHRDDLLLPDGTFKESFVVVQNKTGKRVRHHLRDSTRAAMATLPVRAGPMWALWGRLENWRREAAKLVRKAGLPGAIGRLRHSSGTAVERICPGRGHEHLGNTRQVFEAHYLDAEQIPDDRPLPPALD